MAGKKPTSCYMCFVIQKQLCHCCFPTNQVICTLASIHCSSKNCDFIQVLINLIKLLKFHFNFLKQFSTEPI